MEFISQRCKFSSGRCPALWLKQEKCLAPSPGWGKNAGLVPIQRAMKAPARFSGLVALGTDCRGRCRWDRKWGRGSKVFEILGSSRKRRQVLSGDFKSKEGLKCFMSGLTLYPVVCTCTRSCLRALTPKDTAGNNSLRLCWRQHHGSSAVWNVEDSKA
jgi:hypothetical protein